jgi:hypothetical protein
VLCERDEWRRRNEEKKRKERDKEKIVLFAALES